MVLSPSRLSATLRSISDRIDRSRRPSRAAVASELRRVLTAMGDDISKAMSMCPDANLSMIGQEMKRQPGHQGENWSIQKAAEAIVKNGWTGLDTDGLIAAILESGVHQGQDPTADL